MKPENPRANDAPPGRNPPHNRLIYEKSPYLLQHAGNPVDWYPWGDEAFARAAREDKPVFLSIGYATCHWCHVMAYESFEDPEVAALLNEAFICIKVDREERPDIDSVYMTICQMVTGQGGWPLTIVMTPDKKPFFAATYIPRESRFSLTGLLDLLPRIVTVWREQRRDLLLSAEKVIDALHTRDNTGQSVQPDRGLMDEGYEELVLQFDPEYGGFGNAPKFPAPPVLLFLIRYGKRTGNNRALAMAEKTLDAMRRGGICDQAGGGFHRYSTDAQWRVPHFEKMLYDQALLLMAYTEAYQATKNPSYRKTAEEIIRYVFRDLTSPEGAFYSAEDADSPGGEGAFYLWTTRELETVLGDDDAAMAALIFGALPAGNYSGQQQGGGENILHQTQTLTALAASLAIPVTVLESRLESIRARLFAARQQRARPALDDKVLTDWNGLFVAALAQAARVWGEATYLAAAERAMQFILITMRSADGGLVHRYRDGDAGIPAFADDYAFTIHALIELYETSLDGQYLSAALALNACFIAHFWDGNRGGFFTVSDESRELIVRRKEIYDGALPSCNSVACENLLRLSRLTGDAALEQKASALTHAFSGAVSRSPAAHAWFLCALSLATGTPQDVVIAGERDAPDTQAIRNALREHYLPDLIVLLRPPGEPGSAITTAAPFTRDLVMLDGKATVYVCSGHACVMPVTDPEEMLHILGAGEKKEG